MNRVVSISTTDGLVCGVRALFWAWALTEFGFLAQVLYACASVIGRCGRGVGGVSWHSLCGMVTPGFAKWRPLLCS